MKKIVSVLLVCVLLVGMVAALTSCGPSGTYEHKVTAFGAFVSHTQIKFSGSNVTVKVLNEDGEATLTYKGSYELNEDGDEITVTFEKGENADGDSLGQSELDIASLLYSGSFAQGDDAVTINGVTYTK